MAAEWGLSQLFHLLVIAYFVRFNKFACTELTNNILAVNQLGENVKWMLPQFATFWTQFVIQDYFVLSFLEDLLAWTPKTFWMPFKRILSDHANNLFTTYVIPFTLVMCVNFWVIFFIDPSQIDEHDVLFDVFDRVTNHIVHTYVIPLMFVEMCLTRRYYPHSVTVVYPYVKITITFSTYYAVVFGMKLFSPVWPYPLFKAMTVSQWVPYIAFNLLLTYASYALGFICHSFVWGKQDLQSVKCSASSDERGGWEGKSTWRKLLRIVQVVESR